MTTPAVTVYTGNFCGYCVRALALLERRGIAHTEINVEDQPGLRDELRARSGWRTLPQIYVGELFIGGADELAAMDRSGELLKLIQARHDDG